MSQRGPLHSDSAPMSIFHAIHPLPVVFSAVASAFLHRQTESAA